MLISLKLMKRKNNKVYEEPAGGLTYDFGKHLPRGQAWHNFNLPGNQYNIYLYVVWGEMLKQTTRVVQNYVD